MRLDNKQKQLVECRESVRERYQATDRPVDVVHAEIAAARSEKRDALLKIAELRATRDAMKREQDRCRLLHARLQRASNYLTAREQLWDNDEGLKMNEELRAVKAESEAETLQALGVIQAQRRAELNEVAALQEEIQANHRAFRIGHTEVKNFRTRGFEKVHVDNDIRSMERSENPLTDEERTYVELNTQQADDLARLKQEVRELTAEKSALQSVTNVTRRAQDHDIRSMEASIRMQKLAAAGYRRQAAEVDANNALMLSQVNFVYEQLKQQWNKHADDMHAIR